MFNVGDMVKHPHLWVDLGSLQHRLSRVVHTLSPSGRPMWLQILQVKALEVALPAGGYVSPNYVFP